MAADSRDRRRAQSLPDAEQPHAPREPDRDAAVVAGPHDRVARAAAREDDAVLARALHQLAGEADVGARAADAEPALPRVRAGQRARPHAARVARPGDAALPRQQRQRQGASQRELRARAHGAVHARHRQLHRAGHPRVGPRVHRLDVPQEPRRHGQLLRQPQRARRRLQDVPRPDRQLQRQRHRQHHLPAAGGVQAVRHQAAVVLRLHGPRAGSSSTKSPRSS